ncbi:MAG: serine hydrolase [Candidatus Omnitrophica bacterium]|nr:serine hydrolase [Candidatus Omnitrophota bacterium]
MLILRFVLFLIVFLPFPFMATAETSRVFPGKEWEAASPEEVGLDSAPLDRIAEYLGGEGCLIRHGKLIFGWGDYTQRRDVASAVKPWFTHFLLSAIEKGLLPSLDTPISDFVPCLKDLNPSLEWKDRLITFRHMDTQTSCYGVAEKPGTAFDYNDFQMALFFDTLMTKVYGVPLESVDEQVLHPLLTDILQCQDNPTFYAFGPNGRAGRLGVSPRDFARFGWLYLNGGQWNGKQIISEENVHLAVSNPLPVSIPRTKGAEAEMCSNQRTLGSQRIPDNQCDHHGSYSYLWWVNGIDRDGERYWPDAPTNVFTALGHKNGKRGIAAIPSLDIVLSWNDTKLDNHPEDPHPLNEVFRLLNEATSKPIEK